MRWTPVTILAELRRLRAEGVDLGYRALARSHRPLVSAAAYHFGSFRRAVDLAGIDYESVCRRPRWTKARVISVIKSARRRGSDLSWTAVISGRDRVLRCAAFVAVQKRMFGSWPRALQASGTDDEDARRYQRWDKTVVVAELKQRYADGESMNSRAVQLDNAPLHAAAIRYFGSFDKALRAAKLNPAKLRKRSRRS